MSRLLSVGTQTKQTFVTLLWKCLEDLIEFLTFYLYYNDNLKFDGHPCFKIAFFYRSSVLIEHIFKYSSKFILTILLMKSDRDFLMNHNIFGNGFYSLPTVLHWQESWTVGNWDTETLVQTSDRLPDNWAQN